MGGGIIMRADLDNFNNIYADLAESAYNNRPTNFPFLQLKSRHIPFLS
jgi:hypothetical protein